jgi:multidrug efflux system membrane fusion protein
MVQSLTPLRYPLAALALVVISACGKGPETAAQAPAAAKVNVAKVLEQPVNEWDEVTARLEAPETVQVRPRVSGQIDSVAFTDGELVKKGDLLFQIDPRPFEAEVQRRYAATTKPSVASVCAPTTRSRQSWPTRGPPPRRNPKLPWRPFRPSLTWHA